MSAIDKFKKKVESLESQRITTSPLEIFRLRMAARKKGEAQSAVSDQDDYEKNVYQVEKNLPRGVSFEPSDVDDFGIQRRLATLDDLDEKVSYIKGLERFKGAHVMGMKTDEGDDTVVYRMQGDDKYKSVNDPTSPVKGKADLYRHITPLTTAEGLAGTAVSLIDSGKSKIARYLIAGLGSAAGRAIDEFEEYKSGFNRQSSKEVSGQIAESGAFGAAGELAGDALSGIKNFSSKVFKGGNIAYKSSKGEQITLPEKTDKNMSDDLSQLELAQQAAIRQGFRPIDAGEAGSQVAERVIQRGVSLSGDVKSSRELSKTLPAQKILSELEKSNSKQIKLSDSDIEKALESQKKGEKNKALESLKSMGLEPPKSKQYVGDGMISSIEKFRSDTSKRASDLYDNAFDIAVKNDLKFDFDEIAKKSKKILKKYDLGNFEEVDGDIMFITSTSFSENLDPRLAALSKKAARLEGVEGYDTQDEIQSLRVMQNTARELSEKDVNRVSKTNSQRLAGELLGVIRGAMSKAGGDAGKDYSKAISDARKYYAVRGRVLKSMQWDAYDKIGGGEELYRHLRDSGLTRDSIRQIKRRVGKNQFKNFKSAMAFDMLADPSKKKHIINSLDGNIGKILEKETVAVIDRTHKALGRLDQSKLAKSIEAGVLNEYRSAKGILSMSETELDTAMRSGAVTQADAASAALSSFMDKSLNRDKGVLKINPSSYQSALNDLKKSPAYEKGLTTETKRMLDDIELYSSFVSRSDSGAILAAAALIGRATDVASPIDATKAGLEMYNSIRLAKMAQNPAISHIFSVKDTSENRRLKAIASFAIRDARQYYNNDDSKIKKRQKAIDNDKKTK